MHEEVNRLPEKYRLPVILSYLEGRTNDEVAELLELPVGTVKGRLSRPRNTRSRLTEQRGLVLSAAFLMTALSRGRVFAEVVPSELVQRTVRSALTPGSLPVLLDPLAAGSPPGADLAASLKPTNSFPPDRRQSTGWRSLYHFLALFLSVAIGGSLAMAFSGGTSLTSPAPPGEVPEHRPNHCQ